MISKKSRTTEVHDITLNQYPITLIIDVIIGDALILGFQINTRSSVNLMNVKTMNEMGIANVVSTNII